MRILFWSGTFWPSIGGVEVVATNLITVLREHGYKFIVVTPQISLDIPSETHYKGVPVRRFPFWTTLADGNIDQLIEIRNQLAELKRTFAPDLVHINSVDASVIFHLHTNDSHPAPLLVTLHDILPSQGVGRDALLGQLIHAADWVTCVSKDLLFETRKQIPKITSCSSVIYNGLTMPAEEPYPLPISAPRLLCIGRLVESKGFDLALEAFARIRSCFPHVRLVIAGDGRLQRGLLQQAYELGLSDFVDFVGWVTPEKVPTLMNAATVVLMPSRKESFGLVALEAALMGRPTVATRVGGLSEVVEDQQTGLLVEPEDTRGLAEAVMMLLEKPNLTTQMGRAARIRAQKFYSMERCADAYAALYQKLGGTAR